jgi:AAA domain, putative AbiEii toxin, Type IV TA system
MHLESIKVIKDDHYFLEEGFEIKDLLPINLLVGDQGCGKSSILGLLQRHEGLDIKMQHNNAVNSLFFDFEHMNPRVIEDHELSNPDGSTRLFGVGEKLASKWRSHGETLKHYSIDGLNRMEDTVVLFDEPESSLSLRNQYELVKACKKAAENNCQLIIATHCLPLIESQEFVYSMEHKEWMPSKEFIKLQKDD